MANGRLQKLGDGFGPFTGRAGELRVASELLLRGINVASPEIDNRGVDLVTIPDNKRIQVKASRSEYSNTKGYKYPAYLFNTRKKKYISSTGKTLRPKIQAENIDFLVCWCIDDDWFYIIPSDEITQTTVNIPIHPERPSKYQQYLNAWDLITK